jgi:hypothetical protein
MVAQYYNASVTTRRFNTIFLMIICYLVTACKTSGQEISLLELLNQKPQEVLLAKNIKFKLTDIEARPNYTLRLYGEIIPSNAVKIPAPEYRIDWDGGKSFLLSFSNLFR